jgi:5-formyltetrahydrofolate cyclo-ligase
MDNYTKSDFRKNCIKKLKHKSKLSAYRTNKSIVNELKKMITNTSANNIFLYLALDFEVNLKSLIDDLKKDNKKVFVPYMVNDTIIKAVPYRLPLHKKKYNIYEPNNSFIKYRYKFDLAIVPIIGFDNTYRRIGFGAGYYDRYFAQLNYLPTIVFTQMCRCKFKNNITHKYDIKADYIITNKGFEKYEK